MVIMASGIARGRVRTTTTTTTTESRKTAAILQVIGWQRHAALVYRLLLWYWTSMFHSGQTTGHSREHTCDLSTSGQFPSPSHKIPRSTSATRAISVLSSIILPLQTFFSRVLLLRQQPFSSENLPPERPTTTIAIKTQVFMFRYESVNSTRKFTVVAEIVSLLKKIYKRDAPFRAVSKVKTLAVLFSAYPREMKHIPRNLNLPPFWRCLFLWKWCNPFPRARARLKHAHSFDRCGHPCYDQLTIE